MLERVGEMAYKLSLPLSMSAVHYVLHVSLLKRYVPDLLYQISYEELELPPDLSYDEEVMRILDCYSMSLCAACSVWLLCEVTSILFSCLIEACSSCCCHCCVVVWVVVS